MYYKVKAAIGKKRSLTRTIYVAANTIADAMNIAKKIKGDLISIYPINREEYMHRVNLKYSSSKA